LGVCKHLEAVRRGIRTRAGLHKAFQRLGTAPDRPTLTVAAQGGLSLKALGAWPPRVLKPEWLTGAENGAGLSLDHRLLQPGYPETIGVRVVQAVRPALLLQQTRSDHRRRAVLLRKAAGEGHLGVDVLSKPLFTYQTEGVLHLLTQGRAILADQTTGVRSYRDLITAVLALRPEIEKVPGDYVGIMLPASGTASVMFLAVLFAGKTPVMVNWTVGARNLAHGLDLWA